MILPRISPLPRVNLRGELGIQRARCHVIPVQRNVTRPATPLRALPKRAGVRRACRACPSCPGASPFWPATMPPSSAGRAVSACGRTALAGGPRRFNRRPQRLGRRASPFQPAAPAPRTEGPAASLGGPVASTDGPSCLGRRGRRPGGCGAGADFAAAARPRAVWVTQRPGRRPGRGSSPKPPTAQMRSSCPMCRGPRRTRTACEPPTHACCDSLRRLRWRIVRQLDRGLRHEERRRLQP